MPLSIPGTLSNYITRMWFEGEVVQGNPLGTVIRVDFPYNAVWEQTPGGINDIIQWSNIHIIPGLYTLTLFYVDGPVAPSEIIIQLGQNTLSHTINLNQPPVAELVQYQVANLQLNDAIFDLLIRSSNFGLVSFTAGSFISLRRE